MNHEQAIDWVREDADRRDMPKDEAAAYRYVADLAEQAQALKQERENFYMDYRMKCDEQTKAAHVELEGWREYAGKLEEALKVIAQHRDMTLLGPDKYGDRQHEVGATKAFNECADFADAALAAKPGEQAS